MHMASNVLELVGLMIWAFVSLNFGWRNPKCKLPYLKTAPEELLQVTHSMDIYFLTKGQVGGPGSQSLFVPTQITVPILS